MWLRALNWNDFYSIVSYNLSDFDVQSGIFDGKPSWGSVYELKLWIFKLFMHIFDSFDECCGSVLFFLKMIRIHSLWTRFQFGSQWETYKDASTYPDLFKRLKIPPKICGHRTFYKILSEKKCLLINKILK